MPAAQRPFLLVASFVNPHDIVLFPGWVRRSPIKPSPLDPPHVPAAPTADEDLATKPAAQIAFREAYATGYGPAPVIDRAYRGNAQRYRDLYYRLHAEVDGPIDRVRRAVTEGGSDNAVLVRTSDHGDLLGAHGGLHQKWFNLYDEATRVPFVIARIGGGRDIVAGRCRHRRRMSTCCRHCWLRRVSMSMRRPTDLAESFSEVHPLPGQNLMPVVDGGPADDERAGLHHDPRQHARRRHRRLGGGPQAAADVESTSAAAYPGACARRVELRGLGGPRRRSAVEAGAHLRRSGDLDRTGSASPRRRTGLAARRIG